MYSTYIPRKLAANKSLYKRQTLSPVWFPHSAGTQASKMVSLMASARSPNPAIQRALATKLMAPFRRAGSRCLQRRTPVTTRVIMVASAAPCSCGLELAGISLADRRLFTEQASTHKEEHPWDLIATVLEPVYEVEHLACDNHRRDELQASQGIENPFGVCRGFILQ